MGQFINIITLIAGGLIAVASVAALMGVAYAQFKKGARTEKNEVIDSADTLADFWHKQADEYKEAMAAKDAKYAEQINGLTRELGEVRGELKAAQANNVRLEQIFQGRNPEMEEFMKFMVQSVKDQTQSHSEIVQVLKEIHQMSSSNHKLLEDESEVKIEGTIVKNPIKQ